MSLSLAVGGFVVVAVFSYAFIVMEISIIMYSASAIKAFFLSVQSEKSISSFSDSHNIVRIF